MWSLLARLAGRGDDPPGHGVVLSPHWAVDLGLSSPARADDPLATWILHLVARVRARLARAMPSIPEDDLADVLLRHDASVHVSATRLDVTLSLATLPLAIRLAGLDRDAGWLPSAGRSLRFHFI